jgi:hypothetical protein
MIFMNNQLVKVLLLIPRKKENENISSEKMQHRKCFRKVWSTEEEREVRIKELMSIAGMYPEYKWRIYETINWRDLRKAYFSFQARILEWQRNDKTNSMEWLQDYNSEWVSNLMRPESCTTNKFFMIDKDDKENIVPFMDIILEKTKIIQKYETVNGIHFIVIPFNSVGIDFSWWNAELHKDGLALVWSGDKGYTTYNGVIK